MQILIDAGTDMNIQNGHYDNALQAASEEDYDKIMQILINASAVNRENSIKNDENVNFG
jgi:hypothetical protein